MEWILIFGGLYFLLNRSSTSGLKTRLGTLLLHKLEGKQGVTFRVNLIVSNYINDTLNIKSFAGEIYANGNVLAPVKLVQDAALLPNQSKTFQLEMTVPYESIMPIILLLEKNQNLNFQINGSLAYDTSNSTMTQIVRDNLVIELGKWAQFFPALKQAANGAKTQPAPNPTATTAQPPFTIYNPFNF